MKYNTDKIRPTVRYGSMTGIPPIHANNTQITTNIQKKNLWQGLNDPLLIILFFII